MELWSGIMEVGAVIGPLGGIAGLVTAFLGFKDRRRRDRAEHRKGPKHVTARLEELLAPDEDGKSATLHGEEVIVTNEGPLPVTIVRVELGPGVRPHSFLGHDGSVHEVRSLDPRNPVGVSTLQLSLLGADTFLRSGDVMRIRVVRPTDSPWEWRVYQSIPEIVLVDLEGRRWAKCDHYFVEVDQQDPTSQKTRRHIWFEERSWFPRMDAWCFRRAVARTAKHPRRPSILVYVISWLWGWRAGVVESGLRSYLPRPWKWMELIPIDEQVRELKSSRKERPLSASADEHRPAAGVASEDTERSSPAEGRP